MTDHVKIEFQLEQDADGYPPFGSERLWAVPLPDGMYCIDNIPFFVGGISADDVVEATNINGALHFKRLVQASGTSTFRIVPVGTVDIESVRNAVLALGGRCECNLQMRLLAVEIPRETEIQPFLDYLVEGKQNGMIDFEEGALRHSLP